MDRISSLPDSLQCHILSFLPIKESVATSILSRSWRHRWKDLQVFAFKEEFFHRHDLPSSEVEMRFVAFVDAVLEQRRFPHIEKFSLVCETIDQDILTRWMGEAVGSHLQELCIAVQEVPFAIEINLPDSLFTCTSLVSLSLTNLIRYLYHLPLVHLPSLKNLELYIYWADINLDVDNLLLGCPVLEKLELRFFLFCTSTIHVPPTLKSLAIEEEYDTDNDTIDCIEIVTPSLEYLYLTIQTLCLKVVVCNFANMVEAHLDISPNDLHARWVPQLLKALSSAKFLVLRKSTAKCLLCAPVLDLPEFRHLVKLQIDFSRFNSNFLMNMLKKFHVLQVLTIRKEKASRVWILPTEVPNCLVSHLTTVKFSSYHCSEVDQEFIAYILRNGLVLKEVTIHLSSQDDSEKKHSICEELLSVVPRGSKTCEVTFKYSQSFNGLKMRAQKPIVYVGWNCL